MNNYYSTGQAARLLGVKPYRLAYAHSTGRVCEPGKIWGRRAYRISDLEALALHFNVPLRIGVDGVGDQEDHDLS